MNLQGGFKCPLFAPAPKKTLSMAAEDHVTYIPKRYMYIHVQSCILYLNPTAVTEDVGLSEPVNVSLITSGGCLATLNMAARTTKGRGGEGGEGGWW